MEFVYKTCGRAKIIFILVCTKMQDSGMCVVESDRTVGCISYCTCLLTHHSYCFLQPHFLVVLKLGWRHPYYKWLISKMLVVSTLLWPHKLLDNGMLAMLWCLRGIRVFDFGKTPRSTIGQEGLDNLMVPYAYKEYTNKVVLRWRSSGCWRPVLRSWYNVWCNYDVIFYSAPSNSFLRRWKNLR